MGIDLATWRARIGLNYYHQCRYACRPLPVQWRAARWGVGEVVNSTPLVFQGCMAVVSLSLILEYAFHKWGGCPKGRGGCGKVRCPKLGGGSTHSGMASVGNGVCLLRQVCAVVLSVLLIHDHSMAELLFTMPKNYTPLHYVAGKGRVQVVQFFVEELKWPPNMRSLNFQADYVLSSIHT